MPYYYDQNYMLCYEPRLMIQMTARERDAYLNSRAYMLCVDCCAPAHTEIARCQACAFRYAEAGYPEMYSDDFSVEPTAEYIRLMRDNQFVKLNLLRFARRVRNFHQMEEAQLSLEELVEEIG